MYQDKIRELLIKNDYIVTVEEKKNNELLMTLPCGFPKTEKPNLKFKVVTEGFRVTGKNFSDLIEVPRYSLKLCVLKFIHYMCSTIGYSPLYIIFKDKKGQDTKELPLKIEMTPAESKKESDLFSLYTAAMVDSFQSGYEQLAKDKDIIEGYQILLTLHEDFSNG